ncbi:MAG: hypothetical protein ACTSQJ_01760 [Promethearchaeota archaeon]
MSNEKNENKRIFIQISLNQDEKDKINDLAKKKHTSMSDFCRIAIFDYVRKLENPELFQTTSNFQFNPVLLEQLTQNTKKIMELQKFTLERTNVINEMNNILTLIKKFLIKTDSTAKNTIINLFKAHNTLNPKEIIDKTNLDKEVVFSILSELHEDGLIELTSRGRYKWK